MAAPLRLAPGNPRELVAKGDLLDLGLRGANEGRDIDRFDSLIIVAPHIMLDALRSALSGPALTKIVACVDRDLSRIRNHDLPRYLPLHLVYRSKSIGAQG